MQFSPKLEEKLSRLAEHYPTRRSTLVPMLLFVQDEYGFLSKEIIAEVAARIGLTVLEVESTLSYYSMLRKKPAGRHHLQICTNISCLLRGGEEMLEQARKKLGISPGEVTPDGLFSLEEVECIGACSWAPALQVNYDYHLDLTPERFDRLIEDLKMVSREK